MQDVIRMTYDAALCRLDEIAKIWSLSHPDDLAIPSISSGWPIVDALCLWKAIRDSKADASALLIVSR